MSAYIYARSGRNWATLITVLGIWVLLVMMIYWIDLADWIAWLIGLATLPALYDLVTARAAGLTLNEVQISWFAGGKTGEVVWSRVDHVRFDTRLDLSVKASLVLHSGRRVKLPFEATPPHRAFETELAARGVTTQRHHFGFV